MRPTPCSESGARESELSQQFVRERKAAGVVYVSLPDQLLCSRPGGEAPQEVTTDDLRAEVRSFLERIDPASAAECEQRVLDEVLQMCTRTPAPY